MWGHLQVRLLGQLVAWQMQCADWIAFTRLAAHYGSDDSCDHSQSRRDRSEHVKWTGRGRLKHSVGWIIPPQATISSNQHTKENKHHLDSTSYTLTGHSWQSIWMHKHDLTVGQALRWQKTSSGPKRPGTVCTDLKRVVDGTNSTNMWVDDGRDRLSDRDSLHDLYSASSSSKRWHSIARLYYCECTWCLSVVLPVHLFYWVSPPGIVAKWHQQGKASVILMKQDANRSMFSVNQLTNDNSKQ